MFDSDLMNRARLRDESRNRRIRWLRAFVAISTGLQAWQLSLAAILLLLKLRGAGLSWFVVMLPLMVDNLVQVAARAVKGALLAQLAEHPNVVANLRQDAALSALRSLALLTTKLLLLPVLRGDRSVGTVSQAFAPIYAVAALQVAAITVLRRPLPHAAPTSRGQQICNNFASGAVLALFTVLPLMLVAAKLEGRTPRSWGDALWPVGAGVIVVGVVGLCMLPISVAGMISRVENPHLRRLLLLLCGVLMLLFGTFVGGYMATFSMATRRLDGDRSVSYNAIVLPFAISNAVMGAIYFLSMLLRRRIDIARMRLNREQYGARADGDVEAATEPARMISRITSAQAPPEYLIRMSATLFRRPGPDQGAAKDSDPQRLAEGDLEAGAGAGRCGGEGTAESEAGGGGSVPVESEAGGGGSVPVESEAGGGGSVPVESEAGGGGSVPVESEAGGGGPVPVESEAGGGAAAGEDSAEGCYVCMTGPRNAVFLECGHGGLCYDCAMAVFNSSRDKRECPLCREEVEQVVRLEGEEEIRGETVVVSVRKSSDDEGGN